MKKIFSLFVIALFSASMFADTWTVVGSDVAIFGTAYDPTNTDNDMTLKGIYVFQKNDVELAKTTGDWPGYKICKDYGWSKTYPQEGNSYYEVTSAGYYNVVFSFNLSAEDYTISLVPTSVAYTTLYFVNKDNWEDVRLYAWEGEENKYMVWPGEQMTNTGNQINDMDIYSYSVPATYNKVIFSDGGASQSADQTWNESTPCFYNGTWYSSLEAIEEELNTKYFITGDSALVVDAGLDKSKAWDSHAIRATADSYVLSLKAGDYQMQVVTTGGDWKDYDNLSDATKANLGITPSNDGNICFTLTAAGNVTVTYTNETFTVTGANIKPAEMKTLKIVKTRWDVTDVAAKYAVWMCDDKIRDSFTDFGVAGTNDTITVSYHSKASYCIIVRFPGDLETPSWGENDANVWNKTGLVDLDGDVYTAVSLGSKKSMTGTWDAYYPTIKLYGDFAEVGGYWAETALTGDNESVSVSLSLSGSTTYSFKLKINDVQYSKINDTPYELKDNWREVGHFDLDDQGGLKVIKLLTDKAGLYTFTYTYATDMLNVLFPTATAIDNTEAATKAVKRIVNGQLVIEREGKLFNALGAEVK